MIDLVEAEKTSSRGRLHVKWTDKIRDYTNNRRMIVRQGSKLVGIRIVIVDFLKSLQFMIRRGLMLIEIFGG